MKHLLTAIFSICILFPIAHAGQSLVGSQFTYQGELLDNGSPANGEYDILFQLYASSGGINPIDFVNIDDLDVTNGLINVGLDFGNLPFDGEERYLQVNVRPGVSTGNFESLSPRQRINATPYAIQADFVLNSDSDSPWIDDPDGISYLGGNIGIGRDATDNVTLFIDSDVDDDPVRFRVDNSTKLLVHNSGGTSLGTPTEAPINGLLVEGKVLQSTGSHGFLKAGATIECGAGLNGGSISFFNNVNDNDFVTTPNGAAGGCSITVPFDISNAFFNVSAHAIGGISVFNSVVASCSANSSTVIQCQLHNIAGATTSLSNGVVQLAIY